MLVICISLFFFNDTATTEIYTLSLHDALPISVIIDNIVTVEINNDTLAEYGQWPFPRNQLAEEVHRLYSAGAGLVIMPMLFAEPDRFGGDEAFTEMLLQTPTIIGQVPADVTDGSPVKIGRASCRERV